MGVRLLQYLFTIKNIKYKIIPFLIQDVTIKVVLKRSVFHQLQNDRQWPQSWIFKFFRFLHKFELDNTENDEKTTFND